MLSRLDELRRQRALLQEQIARLDREIAAASDASSSIASAPVIATAGERTPAQQTSAPSASSPSAPAAGAEVDALFNQLRAEEETRDPPPTKRGCWIIFLTILAVGVGIAAGLIYFLYR